MRLHNADEKSKKMAIIFVHGLNGSSKTWVGEEDRFIDCLKNISTINDNCSLYTYEYYTKIFEPFRGIKRLLAMIPGSFPRQKEKGFNTGIRLTARSLSDEIQALLQSYECISLVSHSMGGLVTKKAFTTRPELINKISFFASLSVPHKGVGLAKLGKKLLRNPQLIDLASFSNFTSILTQEYSDLTPKPYSIYQRGIYDEVVPEGSAIPAGVENMDRLDSKHNHFSVLKGNIKGNSIVFERVVLEIHRIMEQWSSNYLTNTKVNIEIPIDWSFEAATTVLSNSAECTIRFEGFNNDELKIILRSSRLRAKNTFEALKALQTLGIQKIPNYEIQIEGNEFKLIRI